MKYVMVSTGDRKGIYSDTLLEHLQTQLVRTQTAIFVIFRILSNKSNVNYVPDFENTFWNIKSVSKTLNTWNIAFVAQGNLLLGGLNEFVFNASFIWIAHSEIVKTVMVFTSCEENVLLTVRKLSWLQYFSIESVGILVCS